MVHVEVAGGWGALPIGGCRSCHHVVGVPVLGNGRGRRWGWVPAGGCRSRGITKAWIIHGRIWQCIRSGTRGRYITGNGTRYPISIGPLVRIGPALHITGVHWAITSWKIGSWWRCCTSVSLILLRKLRRLLVVLMLIVLSSEIIMGGRYHGW